MTRQMADDEVLRVIDALGDLARHRLTMKRRDFDKMVAAGKEPHWAVVVKAERAEYLQEQACDLRAAVAALQAERDALRADLHEWSGRALREQTAHHESMKRAERAESALEALRGHVAGLLNTCVDVIEEGLCASQSYDYRARAEGCAEQIKELLAIKERMG